VRTPGSPAIAGKAAVMDVMEMTPLSAEIVYEPVQTAAHVDLIIAIGPPSSPGSFGSAPLWRGPV
jgi:hypothetical protein